MQVPMTQFIRPDGRQQQILSHNLPSELDPKVEAILELGFRFTAEVIGPNVAQCIEDDEQDLAIEVTSNASSKTALAGLERLVRNFPLKKFQLRRK